MKASLVCLLVLFAVVSASIIPEVQRESRFLFDCDNRCPVGGCLGAFGTRCWGVCYCFGSGYEHRCKYCDL